MSHISAALARIREIQGRAASFTPPSGQFDDLLKAAEAAGESTLQGAPRPHAAHPTTAASTHFTIGQLTGLGGAVAVNGHLIQRPPVDGVLSRHELDRYLDEVGVRQRNGRLHDQELTPVSGGYNGRNGGLLEPAAKAWELMREAAAHDGIDLRFVDSYRTWGVQHAAHQRFLRGEKAEHVLPAGTSEHGVGLAVDITDGAIIRRDDDEWRWLQTNARAFGWWPISNETWHWEFRGT